MSASFFRFRAAPFLLLLCVLPVAAPLAAPAPAWGGPATTWTNNDDMLLFYEALVRIQEQSLQEDAPREMVRKAIQGYLHQIDDFSDYLSPEEYAAWRAARQGGYAGVGMDIFADRTGRVLCLPYPGSPAYGAGIRYGDELTFVGRDAVQGVPVRVVGSWIRGRSGESVSLVVKKFDGSVQSLSLVRRDMELKELAVERDGPWPRIRLFSFGADTAKRLRKALASLPAGTPRVIDLRGNTGGDLFAAIDAAALFLPQGATVVDIRSRAGIKRYSVETDPMDRAPLVLWQDGLTASAAEVFIAALVENHRGKSVGQTTFGKGVTQTVSELSDGSALFLTNGALRTPNGQYYHRSGLKPDRELNLAPGASPEALWPATLELLGK
ncbi:MAG: S41 family peptidase [Desulfovibrio sp.]